jgi:hypothetical protein
MLDTWVIDAIRREQEEILRRERARPRLELPVPPPLPPEEKPSGSHVIVIQVI